MASARPIFDTLSSLIAEDNHVFVLLVSALAAGAVFLMVTITMRRW
jgi:hypothetical protein